MTGAVEKRKEKGDNGKGNWPEAGGRGAREFAYLYVWGEKIRVP